MRLFLAAFFALWLALPALAQDGPDYAAWEDVASRTETAVENARASSQVFEFLRMEIEGFRSQFADAQGVNQARLETLQTQLDALGPVPEEGQTEAPEITERRSELTAQITALAAPGVAAGEAFRRADGIIGEIDAILRERRAEALFSRGPTLLDPSIWGTALRELNQSLSAFFNGLNRTFQRGVGMNDMRNDLPLTVILLIVALVLVLRARRWLLMLGGRIQHEDSGAGERVTGFLLSLTQIVVPMIGLVVLTRALILSGLTDFWGQQLVSYIPAAGLSIFAALWLAGRLFPGTSGAPLPLRTPREKDLSARLILFLTGTTFALHGLGQQLSEMDFHSAATRTTLVVPIIVVAGLLVFRIGQILRGHTATLNAEGEPQPSVLDRLVGLLGRFSRIAGLFAPLLALVGYLNAAEALIFPTILMLALFGTVVLLSDFCRDLYVLLGRQKGADESLIPVLVSILLFLAALPILALIWGATPTDLGEVWVRVQEGVTLGETTISPGSFLVLVVVFALGYTLTRFIQSALRSSVLPKTRLDIGGQTALVSGIGYVGIFLAALVAITSAGLDLSSLAIVAGALSVGIGFGLQNIVSNFISGIILLVERPISEGDWIEVGSQMGYVRDISVRSTRIETFDRTDVIVPNADLISGTVTNYTRGNSVGRVIVPVGVAYGTDTRRVEAILREIAEAHPMVTLKPPPSILFVGFGADSLDFQIRAILRDVNWVMSVKSDINHAIAERFTEEGIEIPFAQRDLWLRNPEVLSATKE
ncbi:MAG: DUF3772 domain-containing protein [Pseudomonadota bacterium]